MKTIEERQRIEDERTRELEILQEEAPSLDTRLLGDLIDAVGLDNAAEILENRWDSNRLFVQMLRTLADGLREGLL